MRATDRTLRDAPGSPTMLSGPVAATALYAATRGIPVARITEVTGLTPADLLDPNARLPERHMASLWRLLGQTFPDEPVGLDMARSAPLSMLGTFSHVAQHATDVREALRLLVRYRSLFSSRVRITFTEGPEESRLCLAHPLDAEDDGLASEMGLGLVVRVTRDVLGAQEGLQWVAFAHAPHGPASVYERHFGVPVRFNAPENALVFRSALLARRPPQASEHVLQFVQAHLDAVAASLQAGPQSPLLAKVRDAIARAAEAGDYSAQGAAKRAGMSLRSLQRALRAEDLALRDLLDETREAHARQLLSDPQLSVDEVAFLLGYSQESAFRRAFKRWTGQTPAQARRAG